MWKVRAEHPETFEIHGNAGPFHVKKASLSSAMADRMRKMCAGGTVKPKALAEGGDPAPAAEPTPALTGAPEVDQQIAAADDSGPDAAQSPLAVPSVGSDLGPLWAQHFQEVNGRPPTQADFMPEAAKGAGWDEAAAKGEPAVEPTAMVASHSPPTAVPTYLARPDAAAPPSMPPFPTFPGGADWNRPEALLRGGIQAGEEAADTRAKAEAQIAADRVTVEQRSLDAMKAIEDHRLSETSAETANIDKVMADIASTKIDPHRFWDSRTTGQKVATGIGLILSGMGSGLTGQPNLAAQFLQRTIDQDIEAQKANLDKKNNLVGWMMKKYGNVQTAAQAATAYQLAALAGQVQLAADRSGDMTAKANALALKSQLQTAAVGAMSQIIQGRYQNAMQRYGLELNRWMYERMGQALQGGAGGGGGEYLPSRAPPPLGADPTNPLKFTVEARKDAAERTVPGPGGRPFLAYDKTVAEKVRPAIAAATTAKDLLGQMQYLRTHASGLPGTDAADVYGKTRRLFAEQWAMTLGQTSLSDTQFKNLEEILPSNWDAFARGKERFSPISKALHERTNALYDQAGLDPRAFPIYQEPVK